MPRKLKLHRLGKVVDGALCGRDTFVFSVDPEHVTNHASLHHLLRSGPWDRVDGNTNVTPYPTLAQHATHAANVLGLCLCACA